LQVTKQNEPHTETLAKDSDNSDNKTITDVLDNSAFPATSVCG